jgi:hypothetical protein
MDEASSALKREGEQIVRDLAFLEFLRQYGEAQLVGSVPLDLVVKRDLDLYVLVDTPDLLGVVDAVYRYLLAQEYIHEVRISDYRGRGGIKVGVDAYPGVSGDWSIDIWVTDRVKTTGFELVKRLRERLKPEHCAVILGIKREKHRQGQLRDGLSKLIYEAVVDKGVRSVEELNQLLAEMR